MNSTQNVQGKCVICKRWFIRSDSGELSNDVCSPPCQGQRDLNTGDAREHAKSIVQPPPEQCEASEVAGGSIAVVYRCETNAAARATWTLGLHHSMQLCRRHLQDILDVCVPLGVAVQVQETDASAEEK